MTQGEGALGGKLFQYIDELMERIKGTLIAFIVLFLLLFITEPVPFIFKGIKLYYIFPSFYDSFAVHILRAMEYYMIPTKLVLINLAPFDIIVSIVYISLAISAAIVVPVLVYQLIRFAEPALYIKERRTVTLSIFPIVILFLAGAVFALKLIIPLLMRVIYLFATDLKVLPTIGVLQFVSIVLLITLGIGLIFETPVVVFSLSYVGAVPPSTWFKHWRYAIIGAFFVALLISPGATGGILEVTLAFIVIGLYFSGALAARWVLRNRGNSGELQ